jgi:hypothetical protein
VAESFEFLPDLMDSGGKGGPDVLQFLLKISDLR